MANPEHLQILLQGADTWNQWREENPEIVPNLEGVDLNGRRLDHFVLSGANLRQAQLRDASLTWASLNDASLYNADLLRASFVVARLNNADLRFTASNNVDFSHADLTGADVSESDLTGVDFTWAKLDGTNFTGAQLGGSNFGNNDLGTAIGLDAARYLGPSAIGIDTLIRSNGRISAAVLQSFGVPDKFITYLSSLIINPIEYNSCFVSYSTKDEEFAKRLYSRLRDEYVRVWFAPEDLQGGRKLYDQIEQAIQVHDRLLVVLSEHSLQSDWVMTEIRKARRVEIIEKRRKLFPIRLVDLETIRKWECFDADRGKDLAVEVREFVIPDFSNWKNQDSFEVAFSKLLRDLRAEEVSQPQ